MDARPGVDVSFARLIALRRRARRDRVAAPSVARPGAFAGRRRGAGLDIHDIRPFVDGDDVRHADPAATARTGRLHVRTFYAEEDRAALLVADFRRPMLWGTKGRLRSVAAAEALAAIGWRVVDAGGKVGVFAIRPGEADYLAPRGRERAMIRVAGTLERSHRLALAEAGQDAAGPRAIRQSAAGPRATRQSAAVSRAIPQRSAGPRATRQSATRTSVAVPTPALHTMLERAGRLVPPGAAIVLATGLDAPGDAFEAVAGSLARRRRLVVLLVLDAVETAPPPGALAYFGDDGAVAEGRFREGGSDPRVATLTALGAQVVVVGGDGDGTVDDVWPEDL